jgi:hypothetical protein
MMGTAHGEFLQRQAASTHFGFLWALFQSRHLHTRAGISARYRARSGEEIYLANFHHIY